MEILDFLKDYWVILSTFLGGILYLYKSAKDINESIKCTLRNDILEIYDRCKDEKKITRYQLESILFSYEAYKKRKGNSFVAEIVDRVQNFELID